MQATIKSPGLISSAIESKINANEHVAVASGLKNQTKTRTDDDPITKQVKTPHGFGFLDSSVFGAKQLLGNKTESLRGGTGLTDISYEQTLLQGNPEDQKTTNQANGHHNRVDITQAKPRITSNQANNLANEQDMELKIDLQIAKHEERLPVAPIKKPLPTKQLLDIHKSLVDKTDLQLEGIGGIEATNDSSKMDELKLLLENNSRKSDAVQSKVLINT